MRKKPSALVRVKELIAKNELQSGEVTSEDAPRDGEKSLVADSEVPPSLHCQEHIPSAASTSDEQAAVVTPVLVDENMVTLDTTSIANNADGENTSQQATDSITDGSVDKERRPDHSEGALEAKRRKICIPEVIL